MPSSSKLSADRLRNAGPGEPVEVWIYSAFEKDQWTARRPGDLTHAEHPGTAIQMGNDLYEVMTAEGTIEPGYVVRYGLKKWDNRHAVRRTLLYTPEAQAQAAEEHLDETRAQDLRKRIMIFFFLAGLAPDPLQRKWERETALNMTVIAAASSLTNFFVLMTLAQIFGAAPGPKVEYVLEYIFFDAIARILWIVFSGQPHGTLILTLPYLLWESVAHPERRAEKKEEVTFSLEGDVIIRRPETGHLTIRSMLYDDLLLGATPITFEGNVYKSLHWHEEGKGWKRRWVYEFEKIDADPKLKYREYTRPRTPARQRVVEEFTRRRDQAHILAMIWGTFPRGEQLQLQENYQFPAAHWTSVTAGFFLAGAVLLGWAMFMFRAPVEFLVCPVYITLESLYRLYKSKSKGEPAASVLGLLVSFFVRPPK
ncbi:MAG: hypothetical protein ACYDA9_05005 [Terriglobia bacterium]